MLATCQNGDFWGIQSHGQTMSLTVLSVRDWGGAPSRDIRKAPAVRRDGMRHLPPPSPPLPSNVNDGRGVSERYPPVDVYSLLDQRTLTQSQLNCLCPGT